MRVSRTMLAGVLVGSLVLSSATVAFAFGRGGGPGTSRGHDRGRGRITAPYKVTKPSVPGERVTMGVSFETTGLVTPAIVTMGVSFETTGLVTPAIAADDASTTVSIHVFGAGRRMRPELLQTVAASLSPSADASSTIYEASITLPSAGEYFLVAVVSKDGAMVSRSALRPVRAVFPYRISRLSVASSKVATDTSFDATMVVTPAIPGDSSAVVTVYAYRCGWRGGASEVASVTAIATGPLGDGTGYTATFSFATPGRYRLVAVLTQDGVVVGKSRPREVCVFGAPVAPPLPAVAGRRRR